MDAETRAEFEEALREGDSIIVDPSGLERRFTIPERNRAMVREFRDVLDNGYIDTKGIQRKAAWRQDHCVRRHQTPCRDPGQLFDDAFADQKPSPEVRYADYVVSGMGADDTAGRHDQDQALQERTFPADPGLGEHARHRLRLPGGA